MSWFGSRRLRLSLILVHVAGERKKSFLHAKMRKSFGSLPVGEMENREQNERSVNRKKARRNWGE